MPIKICAVLVIDPLLVATQRAKRRFATMKNLQRGCTAERWGFMPSTVIRRYVYCPDKSELWVEFVTGRRYVYSGVPQEVASALGSAFAKGVYFNSRIRERFPHREIVHEDQATES